MTTKKKLGQILLDEGLIDEYQLKSALGYQKKWGGRLGNVLVENRFITEAALVEAIQRQTGIAQIAMTGRSIPEYLLKLVPQALAEKHHLIPIGLEGEAGKSSETLLVAMSDPTNLAALDELRFQTGKRTRPLLAGERSIEQAIAVHYRGEPEGLALAPEPEEIQFGGAEIEADSLQDDLAVVQGKLEAAAGPAPAAGGDGLEVEDPFAELEALAAPPPQPTPAVPPAPTEPVPPAAPAEPVVDPFAELDALAGANPNAEPGAAAESAHPAATALDFDLDAPEPQPAAAPGADVGEDADDGLPEIEEIEVLEELEPLEAAADQSPTPNAPGDLSDVPDLEPAEPTPVMPTPQGRPAPAAELEDLPDLEPAAAADDLPTVPGQPLDERPEDAAAADGGLDLDEADLDSLFEPIDQPGGSPPPAAGPGPVSGLQEPPPPATDRPAGGQLEADQAPGGPPPAAPAAEPAKEPAPPAGAEPGPLPEQKPAPEQESAPRPEPAAAAKPKSDSVPTQVVAMSDVLAQAGERAIGWPDASGAGEPAAEPGAESTASAAAPETAAAGSPEPHPAEPTEPPPDDAGADEAAQLAAAIAPPPDPAAAETPAATPAGQPAPEAATKVAEAGPDADSATAAATEPEAEVEREQAGNAPPATEPVPAAAGAPAEEKRPERQSAAMKALLDRVGLNRHKRAAGTAAAGDGLEAERAGQAVAAESAAGRAPGTPSVADPALAAVVRLLIRKGLITAEELRDEFATGSEPGSS